MAHYDYDVRFFVGEVPPESAGEMNKRLSAEPYMVRLGGFTENYHNLTHKCLAIFNWANDQQYDFVLKVDDDTFVNRWDFSYFFFVCISNAV